MHVAIQPLGNLGDLFYNALLFPSFFNGVQRFSAFLPHSSEALSFTADVALTTILVGPASVLMGATIAEGSLTLTPVQRRALDRGELWLRAFTRDDPAGAARSRLVVPAR